MDDNFPHNTEGVVATLFDNFTHNQRRGNYGKKR